MTSSSVPTFGTIASTHSAVPSPVAETPFRMVVLGDFSGRGNRGRQGDSGDIARRKLHKIDRGNFEEMMEKLAVTLSLTLDDETVELTFIDLDDFHPDKLVPKIPRFDDLDTDYQKSGLLRNLLNNADFQSLEAAWRGLDWMLKRAQKGGQVEVSLFDLTLDEFVADLTAAEDLTKSGVYQNLIEKGVHGPKGAPWTLFVGNYLFQPTAQHADVLGRIARIGRETAAPFLGGLPLSVLVKSYDKDPAASAAWTALRKLPEAGLLGLALPRFLMRPPYGENTINIDVFTFEEFAVTVKKKRYLFANAAWACAALLGQGFLKDGWAFTPGNVLDLTDMPMYVYMEDDEEEVMLAEAWLNRQMVEQMGKFGFMSLLCVKGRNQLQLYRFQSLALPAANEPFSPLLGSWGQEGVGKMPSRSLPSVSVGMGIGDPSMKAPPPPPPAPQAAPKSAAAAAAPPPVAAEAPAEEMDPELAALMAELEQPAAPAPPPAAASEPAAEPEMDPELAALMAELEGGAPAAAPPPAPATEETGSGDPELDALMKELEGGAGP